MSVKSSKIAFTGSRVRIQSDLWGGGPLHTPWPSSPRYLLPHPAVSPASAQALALPPGGNLQGHGEKVPLSLEGVPSGWERQSARRPEHPHTCLLAVPDHPGPCAISVAGPLGKWVLPTQGAHWRVCCLLPEVVGAPVVLPSVPWGQRTHPAMHLVSFHRGLLSFCTCG